MTAAYEKHAAFGRGLALAVVHDAIPQKLVRQIIRTYYLAHANQSRTMHKVRDTVKTGYADSIGVFRDAKARAEAS